MNTLRDKTYEEMSYTEKAMVHVDNYQYDKAMALISITQAEAMERQAAALERIAAVLEAQNPYPNIAKNIVAEFGKL